MPARTTASRLSPIAQRVGAEPGLGQHQPVPDGDHRGHRTGTGIQPPRLVLPTVATDGRDVRDLLAVVQQVAEPGGDAQGAQRDDERGDRGPGDQQPVERAERAARPAAATRKPTAARAGPRRWRRRTSAPSPRPRPFRRSPARRRPTGRCRRSRSRTSHRPRAAAPRSRCWRCSASWPGSGSKASRWRTPTMMASSTPPIHRSRTAARHPLQAAERRGGRRHPLGCRRRLGRGHGQFTSASVPAGSRRAVPGLGPGDVADQVLRAQLVPGQGGGQRAEPQHHDAVAHGSTSGIWWLTKMTAMPRA